MDGLEGTRRTIKSEIRYYREYAYMPAFSIQTLYDTNPALLQTLMRRASTANTLRLPKH